MEKVNYQIMLDKKIEAISKLGKRPRLLLHSCCAPCSSSVLEYLNQYFEITLYYYNPNITPESEFEKRFAELERFCVTAGYRDKIKLIRGCYETGLFEQLAEGLENEAEGGDRCERCYRLRIEKTAQLAKAEKFDYFTTTLSVSPYKNAQKLNQIGKEIAEQYKVEYLFSDFKKKNGYKRSCELSREYGLYRQNYCGCKYSKIYYEAKG
ncbi:MAG: epoxyqueuosine reductase QueH [bacterium]|nr:epoxyqueuosine reductase QueH [bacterium]